MFIFSEYSPRVQAIAELQKVDREQGHHLGYIRNIKQDKVLIDSHFWVEVYFILSSEVARKSAEGTLKWFWALKAWLTRGMGQVCSWCWAQSTFGGKKWYFQTEWRSGENFRPKAGTTRTLTKFLTTTLFIFTQMMTSSTQVLTQKAKCDIHVLYSTTLDYEFLSEWTVCKSNV